MLNDMEFRDLKRQYEVLKSGIDAAVLDCMNSASFIGGAPVRHLEKELAGYIGVRHCISCANGTDALQLALMAWGIGPGDAVIVPDFTYFSSGEVVSAVGATPVFADIDRTTFNIDPDKLEDVIKTHAGVKAVIAVDLFGLPADYDRIRPICEKYGLKLLEDGAQGFGGSVRGKKACSFGDIGITSFFPAKPLGCYGDGGAIFTDNDEWAELLRSYAIHGKGSSKYDNVRVGMNSRLDTIQAAILDVKFRAFVSHELEAVNKAASEYDSLLKDAVELVVPSIPDGYISSWAQYTVLLPYGADRDLVQAEMKSAGIPTMVYYMKPMHQQTAFAGTESANAGCPVTEEVCRRCLSLPMDPYKTKEDIQRVSEVLRRSV